MFLKKGQSLLPFLLGVKMTNISDSSGLSQSSSQKSEIGNAYIFKGDNSNPIKPKNRKVYQKVIIGLFKLGRAPFKKVASKIVSRIVIPAAYFNKAELAEAKKSKDTFLEKSPLAKTIKLTTFDDAELDGMVLFSNKKEQKKFESGIAGNQKWIILANGNAELYEHSLFQSEQLAEDLQANVLTFNYRGVGESQGHPHKMDDLIADADTCVQYLISKGVKEEDIIIRGHSLGGGIATKVASTYEEISLINTNSYASIAGVAKAHIRVPVITTIVAKIIQKTDWELNAAESWNEITAKKLIVFHTDDAIMLKPATLFNVVKQTKKKTGVSKNKTVTKIETTKKFGVEHIKITKNMGIYDRSIVVIYDTHEEIKENLSLQKADLIRDELKTELKKMYSEVNKLIEGEQEFEVYSNYHNQLTDIADIDQLRQNVDDEIAYIEECAGKLSDETAPEAIKAIEKILDYLQEVQTRIDHVSDFEDAKFQEIDGHNYSFMHDEETHGKIVGFAKKVFGLSPEESSESSSNSESKSESV